MITEKDLQKIEKVLDNGINRLIKRLDGMERKLLEKKDLVTIEEKLDIFIYIIKRLEIKQEILEEEIITIKKYLGLSSHN